MDISKQAEALLQSHSTLALRRISCECRNGRLILKGRVPSFYLKQVAQAALAALVGMVELENRLEVVQNR
jgi:hypothetical protein